MKKCYIVGAGEFYGSIDPCKDDLVVAADGGMNTLLEKGIVPDVLIGDFDSIRSLGALSLDEKDANLPLDDWKSETVISGKRVRIVKHPVMKDETDMLLAYQLGVSLGYKNFYIYGGVGGRSDHTFANYCLLLKAKNDKNFAKLIGNGTETFVIKNEQIEMFGKNGAGVSVFAFGGDARGVCIKGLKYEAENITLSPDSSLGVSNSFTSRGVGAVCVKDGALLVIREI